MDEHGVIVLVVSQYYRFACASVHPSLQNSIWGFAIPLQSIFLLHASRPMLCVWPDEVSCPKIKSLWDFTVLYLGR